MTLAIVGLVILGALLVALELTIPGGIVGTLGVAAMVTAVVLAFREGSTTGWVTLGAVALALPTAFVVGLWRLPRSRWGRMLALNPTPKESQPRRWTDADSTAPPTREYLPATGAEGVAQTPLRPSGRGRFGSRQVDVITRGEMIDRGARIRVIAVEGGRVVVEAVEDED